MAVSELKKFVSCLSGRRSLLVGLAVLVSAVLLLLWHLGQVTLGQICLVLLPLVPGVYWTSRQTRATEKSTSVAQDNVRVAQEGHLTEGFDRAIEKLGADNPTIRLGGIYALERIAKDSEKDHGRIMELLTAYVREKATKQGQYAEEAAEKPTPDIQAILTVLGRRETTGNNRGNARLDLNNTWLVWADLTDANLIDADLTGVILHWAILKRANLTDTDLTGADLRWAWLRRTILTRADLAGANLGGAKFLTVEQIRSAKNWREAYLPEDLQYLLTGPPKTSSAPSSTN